MLHVWVRPKTDRAGVGMALAGGRADMHAGERCRAGVGVMRGMGVGVGVGDTASAPIRTEIILGHSVLHALVSTSTCALRRSFANASSVP